jgi:Ran GTPase-activating protein (RanGAP) involved in mRNA processing and transport
LTNCQRLLLNHNDIQYPGFCSLGMFLSVNTTLTTLHLKRNFLNGDNCRALVDGIQDNTTLQELVLNFCRFDEPGVEALAECLGNNRHIRTLDLGACYLSDTHVELVVRSLVNHPALETLVLTLNSCHVRASRAMMQLLVATGCQLKSLNLSHQKDYDRNLEFAQQQKVCVLSLATALQTNTTLTSLKLSRNRLQSNDILHLVKVLKEGTNNTLRLLDLNNNCIDDDGMQAIALALPKMHCLQKLLMLNHVIHQDVTARLLLKGMQLNAHLEVFELNPTLPGYNEMQLCCALNRAGRQLLTTSQHVPLALWPLVLARLANADWRTDYPSLGLQAQDVILYILQEGNIVSHDQFSR